jgi:hypothetical protein
MRIKYRCQTCGEPFTRHWNMERHIKRRHTSGFQPLAFPFHNMNDQVSKFSNFKSHNPNYYNANHNFPYSSNIFPRSPFQEDSSIYEQSNLFGTINDPHDSWLQNLRRWVEIKRLIEDLHFRPMQQPYLFPYNGAISQPNMYQRFQPQFRMEDLEIIGYKGYVCKECLTAHPLAIYRHKYQRDKIIPTKHGCDNRRRLEIQGGQPEDNETSIVTNLYMNELPKLMLRFVREWTKGKTILAAAELSNPPDSSHEIIISIEKQWANRAIKDGCTVLTDDELADFINTVKDCTGAYFKVQDIEMSKNSGKVFYMCIGSGHRQCG